MRQTPSITVLFVSDAGDDSLLEAAQQFRSADFGVEIVPDVYAAMARLAKGKRFGCVLVDVRTIDRTEAEFLKLAPRYFDNLRIEVPWLDGTSRAVVQLGQPSLATTEVASIIDSLRTAMVVEMQPENVPPLQTDPQKPARLSTDESTVREDSGPSLHEAVRLRMAEGEPEAPVRRKPPNRNPPPATSAPPTENKLTPEEMEALFDATNLEDGNKGSAA